MEKTSELYEEGFYANFLYALPHQISISSIESWSSESGKVIMGGMRDWWVDGWREQSSQGKEND